MNYDDPGALYDLPGLFYDMTGGPVPNYTNPMKKPKLNLKGLTVLEKIQKANDIVAAMTGNANFTTPSPALAAVTTKSDDAAAAFSSREQAKAELDEKQEALATAEADLDATLTALAAYVANASGGDAEKILSSGMEVNGSPAPVGPMPQVINLLATANGAEGVVTLKWKAVKGAKSYEVQASPDPFTSSSWMPKDPVTKAVCTLGGLPSSSRCWFRVRAIGTAGPGPWSDPAIKTVP
jgi:hypothetical protein